MQRTIFVLLPFLAIVLVSETWPVTSPNNIDIEESFFLPTDTFNQEQALASIREEIKGREKDPAEKVFGSIQILKGMPADRVLRIMEMAFCNALGVTCTHCHDPEDWSAETKPAKQVARDMWKMTGRINSELLKEIPNLQSETPTVNCTTCHRGKVEPALRLE